MSRSEHGKEEMEDRGRGEGVGEQGVRKRKGGM